MQGAQGAVERASANAAAAVEAEIVFDDEPAQKELVFAGRIALAQIGLDPDDRVDAATDQALVDAIPAKTRAAVRYQWGRWLWWCGKTGRHHGDPQRPARPGSLRQWVKDHERMRRKPRKADDGVPQPYAYASVEQGVYLVCTVHRWMGHPSPAQVDPRVKKQLEAYELWWKARGHRQKQAHPINNEESVLVARQYNLTTVGGLRNATAFRLQFDAGCRPGEMLALRRKDVWWEAPGHAVVRLVHTKTREERLVGIEAVLTVEDEYGRVVMFKDRHGEEILIEDEHGKAEPVPVAHPDADVDPEVLLGKWVQVLDDQGFDGPNDLVFHAVASGYPRKDGTMAGRVLVQPWEYSEYESAWLRATAKAGVDRDPTTGVKRWMPSYANRAGHITTGVDEDIPLEVQAKRTGHAPGSKAIGRYYRSGKRWGGANTGTVIRRATARRRFKRKGGSKGS